MGVLNCSEEFFSTSLSNVIIILMNLFTCEGVKKKNVANEILGALNCFPKGWSLIHYKKYKVEQTHQQNPLNYIKSLSQLS